MISDAIAEMRRGRARTLVRATDAGTPRANRGQGVRAAFGPRVRVAGRASARTLE